MAGRSYGYGNGGGQQYMDDTPPSRGQGQLQSPRSRDSYGGRPGGYGSPGGRPQGSPGGYGGGGHHGGVHQIGEDISDCNVDQLMDRLRTACKSRGAGGIKQFRRMFKIYDRGIDDKKLSCDELYYGVQNYGIEFSQKECKAIILRFSRDGDDTLSFDEFMRAVRPPMSECRKKLIEKAFKKMDRTGDGKITADDLKGCYKVDHHPKYKSGEWTAKRCFEDFLKSFEPDDKSPDGEVTWEEFVDYYSGVSSSIDKDVYFDYMMRQAWKI